MPIINWFHHESTEGTHWSIEVLRVVRTHGCHWRSSSIDNRDFFRKSHGHVGWVFCKVNVVKKNTVFFNEYCVYVCISSEYIPGLMETPLMLKQPKKKWFYGISTFQGLFGSRSHLVPYMIYGSTVACMFLEVLFAQIFLQSSGTSSEALKGNL